MCVGDAVLQRGTNHAWANRSDRPVRMVFVLIDAIIADELRAAGGRWRSSTRSSTRCTSPELAALTIPPVIPLVALVVLSVLLFRGRDRNERREAAAEIQCRSAKDQRALHARTHLALGHAQVSAPPE